MRDRHLPRLCHSCQAPMARQEDACWQCGVPWLTADGSRTTLHVISAATATDAVGTGRAMAAARLAMDRWVDEGGSVPREAAALLGATIGRR
jgi:predicted amidophosphoribosyltransferase